MYINNGDHDNPHESPQNELEGCNISQNTLYSHHTNILQDSDWFDKLHYIYQHFQDSEKMHQLDPETETTVPDNDSLYPYVNNDIEYRLLEDIVDSYYLDSQIKDDLGGLINSHFWLEIPLKLNHQIIQIKALVCDSECPYDLILG